MGYHTFGAIVAELRKGQFDIGTGKALTQQRLAQQLGVSPRLVEAIEQGSKSYLDADLLVKLADTFALTALERREFFALATRIPDHHITLHNQPPGTILAPLLATLGELQQPAYLHDSLMDMVATNALFDAFWENTHPPPVKASRTNNAVYGIFAYASFARSLFAQQWHTLALRTVYRFRALSLRYRHTTYFKTLFHHLWHLPHFSTLWLQSRQAAQDFYSHVQVDEYTHAQLGQTKYLVTRTTTLTPYGNLYLVTLVPATSQTATGFATLSQQWPNTSRQLMPWPNPDLLDE